MNNSLDIIKKNFINTAPNIKVHDIQSFSFKIKQNGEHIGVVKTYSGITYIKTISPNGSIQTTMIELPFFHNIEERNLQIKDFYRKGHSQFDIGIFMGLSQSQISSILKKYR